MTARARFVDSISATPTVRLDVNAAPWTTERTSRFDPPRPKRARASTLLVDGSIYPASAYEDRLLDLRLVLRQSSSDDAATEIQKLARELDRPGGNIFEYRLNGQTSSVFFRTVRLAMEAVDVTTNGPDQLITAPVIAEPFGYGLREDPVVGVTVSADPAAAVNGSFVDVTGVKGDVETPALIELSGAFSALFQESVFAIRRRGTPSQTPFLRQVESMTQDVNTTTQPNDPAFSGTGNNFSRCTFATVATMTGRLNFTNLGLPASVDLRGTYRVFLRYRKNTATDGINIRIAWGATSGAIVNDTFAAPNTANIDIADLGLISIPFGIDPVFNHRTGVELPVDPTFFVRVEAERTSGTGTLDFDYLVFVPADDRFGIIKWNGVVTGNWWLDAHDNSVHARSVSDDVKSVFAVAGPAGGFPMLSPGETNRIYILYEVGAGRTHLIGRNDAVSVAYFPRYLSVRPAST